MEEKEDDCKFEIKDPGMADGTFFEKMVLESIEYVENKKKSINKYSKEV